MNCIKKLPWSAGTYKADIKYYPQDRVFCEGSVFASLKEQTGNKPKVTVEADGSYSVTEGWMLLAPGNTESGSGVSDYNLLENRPSINGHTLEGDQTAEDLGLMPEGGAYTKEEADGRFQTKEKAAEDLQTVTEALDGKVEKKADKSDVEPYDCSWIFRLANGSEVTYEQYRELDRVIKSGRPLYALYKERNSSVIGYVDGHSDNWTEIGFLLYTSYGGGIRCVVSDYNMVDDGHYSEANTSYWGLQERLVSGASIKTINGVSVLGSGDIKTPAPTKVSELENDKGFLTEHQSLEAYYQKAAAQLDNRVVAEAMVSLAARLDALEGSRGLLGDATAGTVDVRGLTRCRYPLVMLGHGVPAEASVPVNLPDGLPWDGVPAFVGQNYINLDAASGGLYYAAGVDSVADWKQA